jgi:hypothetical protein
MQAWSLGAGGGELFSGGLLGQQVLDYPDHIRAKMASISAIVARRGKLAV